MRGRRLYHGGVPSSLVPTILLAVSLLAPSLVLGAERGADRALDGRELLRIGDLHAIQRHVQEAMPYYQRAIETFRRTNDKRGLASALGKMADLLERQGRLEEAGRLLRDSAAIWAGLAEPREQGRSLVSLGLVFEASGLGTEAQQAYEQAGALFRQAHDREGKGEADIRLGRMLIGQGQAEGGIALLQASLADARERTDRRQQVSALGSLGDWHRIEGDEAAGSLLEEGLALAEAQQDLRAEAGLRASLARLYGDQGRWVEALTMARRSLALYQTLKDRAREAEAWALLGTLSLTAGQVASAAEQHERALTLSRALRDQNKEAASLVNLALTYDAQGLAQEAAETRQKAILLFQSAK